MLTVMQQLFLSISGFPHCRDGLHLTQAGNQIVFEEVAMKLKDCGLSLETLPFDLPLISEIDPNDPLKSFK